MVFYAQVQKETGELSRIKALPEAERNAIFKQHGFGVDSFYIRIQVLGPKQSYDYQDDFANDGRSFGNLFEFIKQQASTAH